MNDKRATELLLAERRRITEELAGLRLRPIEELSTTDLADDVCDLDQEEADVGRLDD